MELVKRAVIFFGITLGAIIITYFVAFDQVDKEPLPIFSPKDVNPELVDSSLHNRGIGIQGGYHIISSFNLLDQLGRSVDETLLKDKIVVADFFFVSCGSICPIMTKNLEGDFLPAACRFLAKALFYNLLVGSYEFFVAWSTLLIGFDRFAQRFKASLM